MSCLAGGPVQVAYAVSDVDTAAARWTDLGAGPFVTRHHIEVADVRVAGRPDTFDHSSAYGWWGEVMVELIAVHHPVAVGGVGLHHVAWFVDSFGDATAELSERGWPEALYARAGATEFAFHDARAELGHFVEIYEGSEPLRAFYASVRDLANVATS